MRVFYSSEYVGSGHDFDTTRKARWVAESLEQSPIQGIDVVAPISLTAQQVTTVHAPEYVEAVRTGHPIAVAESQGFTWDSALWPMVLASNGGAVSAALAAMTDGTAGSLSSGLHHARRGSGAGFCTFNGLVLAAHAALTNGARSVLILDLDAHCGGGTASLIADQPRIWQTDVSVDPYDHYEGSNRIRLDVVTEVRHYLSTIRRRLDELDAEHVQFDLCIYNAGMDPHEGCFIGGQEGITRDTLAARETAVFEWCGRRSLPVAFVLAGGYIGPQLDEAALVELHLLTLRVARSDSTSHR